MKYFIALLTVAIWLGDCAVPSTRWEENATLVGLGDYPVYSEQLWGTNCIILLEGLLSGIMLPMNENMGNRPAWRKYDIMKQNWSEPRLFIQHDLHKNRWLFGRNGRVDYPRESGYFHDDNDICRGAQNATYYETLGNIGTEEITGKKHVGHTAVGTACIPSMVISDEEVDMGPTTSLIECATRVIQRVPNTSGASTRHGFDQYGESGLLCFALVNENITLIPRTEETIRAVNGCKFALNPLPVRLRGEEVILGDASSFSDCANAASKSRQGLKAISWVQSRSCVGFKNVNVISRVNLVDDALSATLWKLDGSEYSEIIHPTIKVISTTTATTATTVSSTTANSTTTRTGPITTTATTVTGTTVTGTTVTGTTATGTTAIGTTATGTTATGTTATGTTATGTTATGTTATGTTANSTTTRTGPIMTTATTATSTTVTGTAVSSTTANSTTTRTGPITTSTANNGATSTSTTMFSPSRGSLPEVPEASGPVSGSIEGPVKGAAPTASSRATQFAVVGAAAGVVSLALAAIPATIYFRRRLQQGRAEAQASEDPDDAYEPSTLS